MMEITLGDFRKATAECPADWVLEIYSPVFNESTFVTGIVPDAHNRHVELEIKDDRWSLKGED